MSSRPAVLPTGALVALLMGCLPAASPRATAPPEPVVVPILFPVAVDSVRFASGWGDPRPGGRLHRGQDLFAPRWSPVLAVTAGVVDWVRTERPPRGRSYALLLRGDDGHLYYYDHLNNDNPGTRDNQALPSYAYARGLRNGDRVAAGEILGYVGDSGNAEPSGPHLHFEIHRRAWGAAFDPAPSLRAALDRRRSAAGR